MYTEDWGIIHVHSVHVFTLDMIQTIISKKISQFMVCGLIILDLRKCYTVGQVKRAESNERTLYVTVEGRNQTLFTF